MTEFISVWALGGESSLQLTTSSGNTTVNFSCTLGPPGALHSLPHSPTPSNQPTPAPHRPRHRGPAEQKRNRQRAARHQAAKTAVSASSDQSPSSLSGTAPVTASPPTLEVSVSVPETSLLNATSTASVTLQKVNTDETTDSTSTLQIKCDQCDFQSVSEKGLKQHTRIKHRISQLDGAEDIFMDESEYTIKALIVTKTIKEGEDTLKFCIHTDVDPNHHTEITHINEESGKVYDGEDKDYNKGDWIENVFTFTISKKISKEKIIDGIFYDQIKKLEFLS